MEFITRIGFRLGISAGALGFLFKVNHWPFGALLLISAGTLIVVSAAVDLARRSPISLLDAMRFVAISTTAAMFVFRNLHWPGASILLIVFFVAGAAYVASGGLAEVTAARASAYKREGWLTPVARYTTIGLLVAQYIFRIQQWPYAHALFQFGILTGVVWVWSTLRRPVESKPSLGVLDEDLLDGEDL